MDYWKIFSQTVLLIALYVSILYIGAKIIKAIKRYILKTRKKKHEKKWRKGVAPKVFCKIGPAPPDNSLPNDGTNEQSYL